MKKIIRESFLLIIICAMSLCPSIARSNEKWSSLFQICCPCDSNLILTSILKSNTGKAIFDTTRYNAFFDVHTHGLYLANEQERQRFFSSIMYDYNRLDDRKQEKLYLIAQSWCRNHTRVDSILKRYNVPFEQAIFYVKQTSFLVRKYLVNKHQNWESLTIWQSEELFRDMMNYLTSLPSNDISIFYKQLNNTCKVYSNQ